MTEWQVMQSEEFLEKLSELPNREALDGALARLYEEISKDPKERGGAHLAHWAYPLLQYHIKARIDRENRTIRFITIFRLH